MTFTEVEAALGRTSKDIGVFVSGLPVALARIVYFHPTSGLFVTHEVRDSVPVLFLSESNDNIFMTREQFDATIRTTIDNTGGHTDWYNNVVPMPPEGTNMVRVVTGDEPEPEPRTYTPFRLPYRTEHVNIGRSDENDSENEDEDEDFLNNDSTYVDEDGLMRRHSDDEYVNAFNDVLTHREALVLAWGPGSVQVQDYDSMQTALAVPEETSVPDPTTFTVDAETLRNIANRIRPLTDGSFMPALGTYGTDTSTSRFTYGDPNIPTVVETEDNSYDNRSSIPSTESLWGSTLSEAMESVRSLTSERGSVNQDAPLPIPEMVDEIVQEAESRERHDVATTPVTAQPFHEIAASYLREHSIGALPAVVTASTIDVPTIDFNPPTPNRATRRGNAQRDNRGRFSRRLR